MNRLATGNEAHLNRRHTVRCYVPHPGTRISDPQYRHYYRTHHGYCQRVVAAWNGGKCYWRWIERHVRRNENAMSCIGALYAVDIKKFVFCITFDNDPDNNAWTIMNDKVPGNWIMCIMKFFFGIFVQLIDNWFTFQVN